MKRFLQWLFEKAFGLNITSMVDIYNTLDSIQFRQKELHEHVIMLQKAVLQMDNEEEFTKWRQVIQNAIIGLDTRLDNVAEAIVFTQSQIKDLFSNAEIVELTDMGINPSDTSNN
jgi:hypothetical protein